MKTYLDILKKVLDEGTRQTNRTGIDTLSYFGLQMRFDLSEGFPLLTTKKVFWRGVAEELFWFISGSTNIKPLLDKNIHIWDEWADKDGNLGPVYGHQWRHWGTQGIDQFSNVINEIKSNPQSRRLIVSAWNPEDIPKMALPPCHCFYQFQVQEGKLNCALVQRSADLFLGVPFNIASYALLTHLVAYVTDLKVGTFVHTMHDAHIYVNHLDQVAEQLKREPKNLPKLNIKYDAPKDIDKLCFEHLILENYNPAPKISAAVAV